MRLTYFQSPLDRSASTHETTWAELCAWIASPPTYPSKDQCPLFKLAVFGNSPSPKGFMRHDLNVVAITGVEADYDAELMAFAEAVERLRKAGVKCAVYTSASHLAVKDGKQRGPRWRVVIPLSVEYRPEYRRAFLDYVNEILGGVLARESWALSSSYYCGRVDGVEYQATTIEGRFLDEIVEPKAIPLVSTTPPDVPDWRHVPLENLPIDDATRALIRDGAPEGEDRSASLMTAANALARARVVPDDILRILSDPAYAMSAKALEGRRTQADAMYWLAKHTVRKALEAFPPADVAFAEPASFAGPAAIRQSLFVTVGELVSHHRQIRWTIRGIMEHAVLGVLFGDPGAGKSIVALDWAACVATGTPWKGRKVTAGAVAYIAGEGYGGIGRRLKAWEVHNGVSLAGANMFVSRRVVPFTDAKAIGDLHGELDAMPDKPALIVIDTLTRATPGMDQNSSKEMGEFVRECDRLKEKYDASVLVIHHSGHADKTRAKGAIDLKGATDMEAGILRQPKHPGHVVLTSTKQKDADAFDDIHLRFESVSLPWVDEEDLKQQTSVVLVETDRPVEEGKLSGAEAAFWEAIGGLEPVDTDTARDRFYELYGGTQSAKRSAWHRALESALEKGAVAVGSPPTLLIPFSNNRVRS